MAHLLDNAVWEALNSRQRHMNAGSASVRYFPSDVSPFVGLSSWDHASQTMMMQLIPGDRSYSVMIARDITLHEDLEIVFSIPLYQMVCDDLIPFTIPDTEIRLLTEEDIPAMLDLTARTKPGPFFANTNKMGNYYGIFKERQLISLAGERLKLEGHTEVSAICTDPGHLGHGYASALTTAVCRKILDEGNTPFLHVRYDNTRAIEVYKKLGFRIRANVSFAIFRIPNSESGIRNS